MICSFIQLVYCFIYFRFVFVSRIERLMFSNSDANLFLTGFARPVWLENAF
jgi:hypothetical protein